MRRSNTRKALCLGFDHRAEIIATVGPLLLHVGADGGQVFLADRFRQQCSVGVAASLIGRAQRALGEVQGQ